MAKQKPYEEFWEKGESLGKGGQGLTFLAKSKTNSEVHALKILKNQTDLERRRRMYFEVAALRILDHEYIPKLVDSNSFEHENLEVPLYMVSEFIPGPTLQDFIEGQGKVGLEDAIDFCINICLILEYCHSKGIYHRDIKPDNIILKNGNIKEPYLIDFGLSFNEDGTEKRLSTPSWEHLGNRFLSLPELRVSQGDKRDHRSDVTMVCGLLIFVLTGVHPTDLIDANQSKPHQRPREKEILSNIEKQINILLNQIFDIGFNQRINDRWQSIEALKQKFLDIKQFEVMSDELDVHKKLEAILKNTEINANINQLELVRRLFNSIDICLRSAHNKSLDALGRNAFTNLQTGYENNLVAQTFKNELGIIGVYNPNIVFRPKFTAFINGSELLLEAVESDQKTEIFRLTLEEEPCTEENISKVMDYYINGVFIKQQV